MFQQRLSVHSIHENTAGIYERVLEILPDGGESTYNCRLAACPLMSNYP